jgi:NTE family protein
MVAFCADIQVTNMFRQKNSRFCAILSSLCLWLVPVAAKCEEAALRPVLTVLLPSGNGGSLVPKSAPLDLLSTHGFVCSASRSVARPVPSNPSRATIALALGGGGIRGAAHIGVLRAFEKQHIPIDYIAGTSMGSVIGGMYAAGVTPDNLEQMFKDRTIFNAFAPVPLTWKLTTLPLRALLRTAKQSMGMKTEAVGLYGNNKLVDLVNSHLLPNRQYIEQTAIPFAAVATNLLDGKTYSIETGMLGKALQASSAIPFYSKPISYDGNLLLDGGLRANLPAFQARKSEADIVISINVNEQLHTIDSKALTSFRAFSNRVISIMLEEIDEHQFENADLEIRPSLVDVSLYSHNSQDAQMAIQAGEEAANMAIPIIRTLMSTKRSLRSAD